MGKAKIAISILIVCIFLIFAAGYIFIRGNPLDTLLAPIDNRTNFVILGLDKGGERADSIVTGCLDLGEKRISLLSVPRDTLITVPKDRLAVMKRRSPSAPDSGRMKINAVYAYGGEEYGVDFTVKQIQDLLGVRIKYYAVVDLEAFRYIVDSIGGVEYDVPFRMKYRDPVQDLYIDLQPGMQLLNGAQAEGLARYRKSDDGSHADYTDINRTQTQQAFIKAVISKLLSDKNPVETASALLTTARKYTVTNMGAADAAKYIRYAQQIKDYEISANTLINSSEYINGASYVIVDAQASRGVIDSVFGGAGGTFPASSKTVPVLVLNGGSVAGLAARTRDYLTGKGYTVSGIGDYQGERVAYTRIFVKRKGMGKDIQDLFPNSRVMVDKTAFDQDIVVVPGLDAK